MKVHVYLLVVTLYVLCVALPARIATATAYVPHTVIEEQQTPTTAKRSAGIICLIHGAEPDVVRQLLGQEFSLFRNPAGGSLSTKTPVGTGRLTDSIGAHYLEAAIIAGELKTGDVAQLGEIYALVVLTDHCASLSPPAQEQNK